MTIRASSAKSARRRSALRPPRSEIEFLEHRLGQLPDHLRRPETPRLRTARLGQRGEVRDQAEIRLHPRADVGAPDLEHDRAAIGERRAVHLRHRRRGEWRGIEGRERGFGRLAERRLDRRAQRLERQRRRTRMEQLEFGDPFGRQQIAASREDLTKLDEGRAEFLEREPRPARQRVGLVGQRRIDRRAREPELREQYPEPEPRRHLDDLAQPLTVAPGDENRGDKAGDAENSRLLHGRNDAAAAKVAPGVAR